MRFVPFTSKTWMSLVASCASSAAIFAALAFASIGANAAGLLPPTPSYQFMMMRAPLSPTSSDDCSNLSRQFSAEIDTLSKQHDSCLAGAPSGDSHGSGTCSHPRCQSLHTARDDAQKRASQEDRTCRARLASYVADAQSQKAHEQARKAQADRSDQERRNREAERERAQLSRETDRTMRQQASDAALAQKQQAAKSQREAQLRLMAPDPTEPQSEKSARGERTESQKVQEQARKAQADRSDQDRTMRQQASDAAPEQKQRAANSLREAQLRLMAPDPNETQSEKTARDERTATAAAQRAAPTPRSPSQIRRLYEKLERIAPDLTEEQKEQIARTDAELVLTYFAELGTKTVPRALLKALGNVTTRPMWNFAEPFLDAENAGNIKRTIDAQFRQKRANSINREEAQLLEKLEREAARERQQGVELRKY